MTQGIQGNTSNPYQTAGVSSSNNNKSDNKQISEEHKQKLLSAGVPQSTIDQGKEAVHSYIQSHPEVKQALEAEKSGAQSQAAQAQGSIMPNSQQLAVKPPTAGNFEAVA